ncbi:MAG TPA: hypothetical protein DCZ11_02485, partial [Gammaproteobacteria bacterium]|nr:hypothetical protein [Gammaproteobacteria bacterium]MCH77292.1 hypothetical protein [Gammaproteobacteria bacterium]
LMNNAIPCAALLLAGLITSQTLAACVAPDGNVTFGDHDTGVADRMLGDGCQTLDGLIRDEDPWGSQGEFVRHVTQVTHDPLRTGALPAPDRARLIARLQGLFDDVLGPVGI